MGLIYALFLCCAAIFMSAVLGADQKTTLHLTSLGLIIVGITVLAVASLAAWAYENDSRASTGQVLASNLRRDNPKTWLKQCLILVTVVALMSGISSWYLLRILVPYISGSTEQLLGIIEAVRSDSAGSAICTKYATVMLESDQRMKICIETGRFFHRRLSDKPLSEGDHVRVVISRTAIGTAVQSVTRVSS
jgi:hypothetical protein